MKNRSPKIICLNFIITMQERAWIRIQLKNRSMKEHFSLFNFLKLNLLKNINKDKMLKKFKYILNFFFEKGRMRIRNRIYK